jgi:hypothetical protein
MVTGEHGCSPRHFTADPDPDPSFHSNADPDSTIYLNADQEPNPVSCQSDANLRPRLYFKLPRLYFEPPWPYKAPF